MPLEARVFVWVLVFLFVLATAIGGCSRSYREDWRWGWWGPEPVMPRAIPPEVLAAETRRAQVIAEIARLTWVARRARTDEGRIALEAVINERRVELDRLNAIIVPR